MPLELTLQARDTHLYFEVSGVRERASDIVDVWDRVARECQVGGFTRILGVSRLSGPVPLMGMYEVGVKVSARLRSAGNPKVAYVVNDKRALENNVFGENVAVNRGLNIRIFADAESALAWLMQP